MIKFKGILLEILNEASIEQLQQQFVDTNKISPEDFDEIKKASDNQGAYATWLLKKVIDKVIKAEDIYKYKKYFNIFNKYKNKFPYKDINQYKTLGNVEEFIKKAVEIEDTVAQTTGDIETQSASNLVPLKGIEELKSVGINLLGVVDGYQVFKVPESLKGNEQAWKVYRKWLAKCSNRKEGEGIEICTMASFSHFNNYLQEGPYYVFFNLKDSRSPYQFHYESSQFMDKNDSDITYEL
jgi:hypothetical protein